MHAPRPLAATLALALASFATVAAPASPIAAAATPAALEAGTDAIFARWNRGDSPGCGVAVFRDGAIAFQKGYGQANLELSAPIGADTVFDIGSTSKQFTAAALLLLERDGKLSLDDDVRKYVPELPDYGQTITLRQLLQHTSGLRDYLDVQLLAGVAYDDYSSDRQTLDLLAKQKALNFAPGSEFVYSNTGYFLAAEIVKRVAGKPLAQFAHERIFAPLGMRDTLFRDDHTLPVRGRASAYTRAEGAAGEAADGIARFRIDMPNWDQVGDGAVLTTLADLQRWDENFYRPVVGDADFLARLQQPGRLADGTRLDYALGLFVDTHRGLKTVSHDGAWGGYRAQLLRFPERHLSVATLCNLDSTDPESLALRVADLWLGLPPEPAARRAPRPTVNTAPAAMQRWAGCTAIPPPAAYAGSNGTRARCRCTPSATPIRCGRSARTSSRSTTPRWPRCRSAIPAAAGRASRCSWPTASAPSSPSCRWPSPTPPRWPPTPATTAATNSAATIASARSTAPCIGPTRAAGRRGCSRWNATASCWVR
ncbi:beta-lactamase family protein [Lysobacter enzymogenes]|nr:serine hydrolase domain-containing protein [Lysobacter enzymogenes]QCW24341.1 beta-lactamase family protein [Lysobacter enzymogenes]